MYVLNISVLSKIVDPLQNQVGWFLADIYIYMDIY